MKVIKFTEDNRREYIILDGDSYVKVPNESKFEAGTIYFKYKGGIYVKE